MVTDVHFLIPFSWIKEHDFDSDSAVTYLYGFTSIVTLYLIK